jgi:glycosyltransferase involved in cell wall biosynthesis
MTIAKKDRVLVFVVAYNAERTIESVLSRIPAGLSEDYDVEILAIDDASGDRTFEIGQKVKLAGSLSLPLRVLFNPTNQGYGGNQKIGYHYAIKNGFDFVALVHGDWPVRAGGPSRVVKAAKSGRGRCGVWIAHA